MKNWLKLAVHRGSLVAVVLASILLIGCKEDDCSISYSKADLIGSWVHESGDLWIWLELDDDGDFGIEVYESGDGDYREGSWTLNGDTVTLTYEPDAVKEIAKIIYLTDEQMGVEVDGEAFLFERY